MKYALVFFGLLLSVVFSCKDNSLQKNSQIKKESEKKEAIYKNISANWTFDASPINATSEQSATSWTEFRQFLDELGQKPSKTIGAFQKKASELSKKVQALSATIPFQFDQPEIKGRIASLTTKVRLLDLFIHLDAISDKKVVRLVGEINTELISLQRQMDKITEKNKIPVEEGESDLLQMLDTARAIPATTAPNLSSVE